MSNYSAGRGPHPADPHPRLRLAALTAVIAGVVLLAAAAFVLSYPGIHHLALRAGVHPGLAKLYPLIFDAMLVVAGAAALALRGARWWARAYAWFSLLLLIAALAAGDAVRTTNVVLPLQPTRAIAAVTPWVLLLLAFGLLLEMLRHFRRARTAGAQRGNSGQAAAADEPAEAGLAAANGSAAPGGAVAGTESAARAPVTWAGADGASAPRSLPAPRSGLDLLLGPREIEPPAMAAAPPDAGAATGEYPGYGEHHDGGQYPDPVAYGPETGYVHPDSYRDPVGLFAGPDGAAGPAGNGGPGSGDVPGQPASPAKARDGAASGKQPAPEPGAKASRPATAAAPPGEAPPAGPGAPPAPKTPATAAAQNGPAVAAESNPAAARNGPAGEAGSPVPGDGATAKAKTPAPTPAPLLERLRSTPAPPED
jgi:uncharacterized protein DUF2637